MTLAVPLLAATTLDASTWEVGLLTAFWSLPFLLIGLPVGAWADRMRRRPVLIAADLGGHDQPPGQLNRGARS